MIGRIALPVAAVLALVAGGCGTSSSAHSSDRQPYQPAEQIVQYDGVDGMYKTGNLFMSDQPDQNTLRRFAHSGGQVVINMNQHELQGLGFSESQAVNSLGMRYVYMPLLEAEITPAMVTKFDQVMSESSGRVLLHGHEQSDAAALWSAWLIQEKGFDPQLALVLGGSAGLTSEPLVDSVRSFSPSTFASVEIED
jgi:protein tyrosine phosphatase (PTP) superfamily phosphohydrolase (DUF442 family)